MNLALVAELMDDFLRVENTAYWTEVLRLTGMLIEANRARFLALDRVAQLEANLRRTLDENEALQERCYHLEVSILECEHHYVVRLPRPPVRRQLNYVDVTSDTDSEFSVDYLTE